MVSYNRVILTGKVATQPKHHYRPDGVPVIQFPLELNDSEEEPKHGGRSLINIVAIGEMAEYKIDHLRNGQHLLVKGRLHQRRWQTPEGKSRTSFEVIATELQAVGETSQIEITKSKNRGEKDEETY